MNATIHPQYFRTLVRCSNCGAEHELGSTRERLSVDICSACHPFYTGTEHRARRAGRSLASRRAGASPVGRKPPSSAHPSSGDGGIRVVP